MDYEGFPYENDVEFDRDIREYASVLFEKYGFECPKHVYYMYYDNGMFGLKFYYYECGYQEHEGNFCLRILAYLPPWKEDGLKLTEIIEIYNAKYNRQIDPELIKRKEELRRIGFMSDKEKYNEYLSILDKISDFEHPTEELQEIRAANRNYDLRNKDRIRLSLRKYSEFLDKYLSDVLSGKNRGWIDVVPWQDEREIW